MREWIVLRLDSAHLGGYERLLTNGSTGSGMPKLMELGEAEKARDALNAAKAAPPVHGSDTWVVNHYVTLVTPTEHRDWLRKGGRLKSCEHCGLPLALP